MPNNCPVFLGQMITYFPRYVFIWDWKSLLIALWVGCCARLVVNECWRHRP